ncbi:MAG: HDOD domain-containing protein [Phycisphaerales bacterium]|nr:HDOD domain-containing protein [Phycisphaerales bacterium]
MSDALQAELRELFARAKMPSSPALAAQIIELAEDPNSTVDQFANIIQLDPALVARLLSMTNSAAYGQRHEVTTIQRAVSVLGIYRVRTVSLGFQLVGHLGRLGGCSFDMPHFWQQSLLRGCLGRELAEHVVPSCADEAFLIGLLQDCGMLMLVQLLGQTYAELCGDTSLTPTAFYLAEKRSQRYDHAETAGALAREWKLPPTIVENLAAHHTEPPFVESPTVADQLRSVTYLIGAISLGNGETDNKNEPALGQFAYEHFGLDESGIELVIAAAAEAYDEMARALKGIVPDDLDVTDLLSKANAHLTSAVETERRESSEQQAQLKTALGEYRDRAARDPLTGVLNRGALTESISLAVQQARQTHQAVTVLFLDLDNFKKLNDNFGHHAGDEVLRGAAQALKECVPNAGNVGRYGGEEFVLVTTGLTEPDAHALGEKVVASIRAIDFSALGLPGPVTCSLGALWAMPGADVTGDSITKAADELMYQAKRSGKNRCCFRAQSDVYNVKHLESDKAAGDARANAVNKSAAKSGTKAVLPSDYRRVARALDVNQPQRVVNMRKADRKQLFTSCTVCVLDGATLDVKPETGFVRNISTGGVGILTPRFVMRGQPIEVAIPVKGKPTLYVAGVVAFCRHAEGMIHEVGVQLFAHSNEPILSCDPISAIRNQDWVANALQSMRKAVAQPV